MRLEFSPIGFPKKKHKFVYVMEFGDLTKIGISGDPIERAHSIETSSLLECERILMSGPYRNAGYYERQCHDLLKDVREKGEFFRMPFDGVIEAIEGREFTEAPVVDEIDDKEAGKRLISLFGPPEDRMEKHIRKTWAPVAHELVRDVLVATHLGRLGINHETPSDIRDEVVNFILKEIPDMEEFIVDYMKKRVLPSL